MTPPLNDDLTDRVVIITGATRGIGRGLARHLGRCGARLVITGRRSEGVDEASAELAAAGVDHLGRVANVADADAMGSVAADAMAQWGRIDGLVANAQTFRPVMPLLEVADSDLEDRKSVV